MKRFQTLAVISGLLFFILTPVLPALAQAQTATLFLSPGSGTYEINKTFTLKVMVNSGGGVGINAADGVIAFDNSVVTVVNVNDAGTIFKLWTTEPTFSNTAGTISFGGGSPSAYKGEAGLIFTVTFKAAKIGTADIAWRSGVVLAADGKGTDVSGSFGNSSISIEEAKAAPEPKTETKPTTSTETETKGIKPPLPEVSSESHPETDQWYSDNRPEFNWKILSDLTGISYAASQEEKDDPGDHADEITEQATLNPLEDGIWYFHIKYKNRYGWGATAHRKFMVDATPPENFNVALDNEGDSTNPQPRLLFKSEDKVSGIENYELYLNGAKTIISPEQMNVGYYRLETLMPGDYEAVVVAIDMAQNSASSSINFIVDPLKAPIITDAPTQLNKNKQLVVQGTSFYPRVDIKVYVACNGEDAMEATVQTDDQNNWSYFHEGDLTKGRCEIWAKVIDNRGAQSLNSSKHLLTVVSPSIIESFGLLIIILLIIIVVLLIAYILYQKHQFFVEKTRILNETKEVKSKLSKIFAALREEVDELIELADKRPGLSESERRVKEKLQESLDISEEFISKEVEDIEKEIKLKRGNFDE